MPSGTPVVLNTSQARVIWSHSPTGFPVDADVMLIGEAPCGVSWAAPVSGNWGVGANWSPAGVGALGVHVVNAGRVRPGASPGIPDIAGSVTVLVPHDQGRRR